MAEIAAAINRTSPGLDSRHVSWAPLAAGDNGAAVEMPEYPDRSVQVRGTFGGTTITLQGSNEISAPSVWQTLTAPGGSPISLTAAGLVQVVEITRWVRPLSTGGAAAAITVEMIAR